MVVTPQVTGSWDDEDNVVMVWSSTGGEASLRSEARVPGEVSSHWLRLITLASYWPLTRSLIG